MAGDWIKMREDLHEDPAVLWMSQQLGCRPETVVGYCHRFWGLVSRQTCDGCLRGPSLLSLGNVISLPGFPELLLAAGWLEYDDSDPDRPVTTIPKFERHLSEGAKKRAEDAERQRKSREKAGKAGHKSVTNLSHDSCDKTVTREEKRREEKKKKENPLPPFPENLQTVVFEQAWNRWSLHRSEIKKPLKPTQAEAMIGKLSEWGVDRAIAAIDHTIAMGWQGLREPEQNARPKESLDELNRKAIEEAKVLRAQRQHQKRMQSPF